MLTLPREIWPKYGRTSPMRHTFSVAQPSLELPMRDPLVQKEYVMRPTTLRNTPNHYMSSTVKTVPDGARQAGAIYHSNPFEA